MIRACGILSAALAILLGGCAVTVDDGDVFRPDIAKKARVNVSTENGPLVVDNKLTFEIAEQTGVDVADGFIESSGQRFKYRYISNDSPRTALVVHCGGTSFDIEHFGDLTYLKLFRFGDILMWEYPGYGDSDGAAGAESLRAATAAMASEIGRFRRYEGQPVVFWGHSLGGFTCAQLAAQTDLGAWVAPIVFEAAAPSSEEAAKAYSRRIPFLRVDVAPDLAGFNIPDTLSGGAERDILILAARRDNVLPVRLSRSLRDLLDAAGHRVLYCEFAKAKHVTIPFEKDFPASVARFYRQIQDHLGVEKSGQDENLQDIDALSPHCARLQQAA